MPLSFVQGTSSSWGCQDPHSPGSCKACPLAMPTGTMKGASPSSLGPQATPLQEEPTALRDLGCPNIRLSKEVDICLGHRTEVRVGIDWGRYSKCHHTLQMRVAPGTSRQDPPGAGQGRSACSPVPILTGRGSAPLHVNC